jgi:hypothetical protein
MQCPYFVGPLDPATLKSTTQWIHSPPKGVTPDEQFVASTHLALDEWFFHGEHAFNEHKNILNPFLRSVSVRHEYKKEWKQLLELFLAHSNQK